MKNITALTTAVARAKNSRAKLRCCSFDDQADRLVCDLAEACLTRAIEALEQLRVRSR